MLVEAGGGGCVFLGEGRWGEGGDAGGGGGCKLVLDISIGLCIYSSICLHIVFENDCLG